MKGRTGRPGSAQMNPIRISRRHLSDAVWSRLFESSSFRLLEKKQAFFALMSSLDALRPAAGPSTGSITAASAWVLYSLALTLAPRCLLEVGTYIGKSAFALLEGAGDAGGPAELHTCDQTHALVLPAPRSGRLVQYPLKSSAEMFRELARREPAPRFELIHLDGYLPTEDFPLLAPLCDARTVVVLDDFEGLEKGVANAHRLRENGPWRNHLVVYPPSESSLRRFGFSDHSTMALLVPRELLQLTPQ